MYGYYIKEIYGDCIQHIDNNRKHKTTIILETVGQYTGKEDINSSKLYENQEVFMNDNKENTGIIRFGEFPIRDFETEEIIDMVYGYYIEITGKNALAEPFCYPFQLTEFYIKRTQMQVLEEVQINE